MEFDSLSTSPNGYTIGYKWNYDSFNPYVEYQLATDNEINLDYSTFNFGTQIVEFSQNDFTVGFNVEGGYGNLSLEGYQNDYDFFSFGGGGFANYAITESFSLFINAQYMYYWEVTSKTECKDGSSSESSGSGTCSHHGGVAYYNDKLGNAIGLKVNVGISFVF